MSQGRRKGGAAPIVGSMPATFPSHAAAVLPLKVVRPRWFDGVALVVGSTAPDLSYPLSPWGLLLFTHRWTSLLWWSLPVTVVLAAVIRSVAPHVAAHLPQERWFALRDYGVLGSNCPRWWVTASSAVLGAATHIFWDGFTHPAENGAWFVRAVPAMSREAVFGQQWWQITQWMSSTVGAVVALVFFVHIGRNRLLRTWHGPAPDVRRNPMLFWAVVAVVGMGGAIATFADPQLIHIQATRLLLVGSAALAVAGIVSRVRPVESRTIPRRFGNRSVTEDANVSES